MEPAKLKAYWKKTVRFTVLVMVVWAFFGYVPTILFVEQLNQIKVGGFPLGFWFAQNGSIYVFFLLTVWYAIRMEKIDREFDVHE